MTRIALRLSVTLGLATAFGLAPLALLWAQPFPPSGSVFKVQAVTFASQGVANFCLALVGTWLFWAVRDGRRRWLSALALFIGAAVGSLFLPLPLMRSAEVFCWPGLYRGDSGFALLLAPFFMMPWAGIALVVFCVSVFITRWQRRRFQFRLRTALMLITACAAAELAGGVAVERQEAGAALAGDSRIVRSRGSDPITDNGLKHLPGLRQLRGLCLRDTRISDAGLQHLAGMSQLRHLDLRFTKVTAQGAQELARALPGCRVDQ